MPCLESNTTSSRFSLANPERLVQAAKTAIALGELFHDVLWQLYPDELILLSEESKDLLVRVLLDGLEERF